MHKHLLSLCLQRLLMSPTAKDSNVAQSECKGEYISLWLLKSHDLLGVLTGRTNNK